MSRYNFQFSKKTIESLNNPTGDKLSTIDNINFDIRMIEKRLKACKDSEKKILQNKLISLKNQIQNYEYRNTSC